MSSNTPSHHSLDAKYESLEVASAITDTATAVAPKYVSMTLQVVAPATLLAGYELEVNVDGETMIAVVPPGGVEEGQTFRPDVLFPLSSKTAGSYNVPVGHWRDGFCDCFKHGCFHPLCWLAYFCGPVVLAQIMYRMKLDWWGIPTNRQNSAKSFRFVVGVLTFLLVAINVMSLFVTTPNNSNTALQQANNNALQDTSLQMHLLRNLQSLFSLTYVIYYLLLMTRTRRYIRNKYAIPTTSGCCKESEDCCYSCWCDCCTITQMARHTADYNAHSAQCCTMTGLPAHIPEIV